MSCGGYFNTSFTRRFCSTLLEAGLRLAAHESGAVQLGIIRMLVVSQHRHIGFSMIRQLHWSTACMCALVLSIVTLGNQVLRSADNFSQTGQTAAMYGVHEVVLRAEQVTGNPWDVVATVTFTPSTGQSPVTVEAFFDGDATWRARVYISQPGPWSWQSRCAAVPELDAKKGSFSATQSSLRGRLLTHPKNRRQWITEDGHWFLHLSDTAYFLLVPHDGYGQAVSEADFKQYVRDCRNQGITAVRCFLTSGIDGFEQDQQQWYNLFADQELTSLHLDKLQTVDRRLQWLLNESPDMYVQLILFPLASDYGSDDKFWAKMDVVQKQRVMRHLLARYAAYPQIYWLIINDAHFGERFPNNNAFARDVGNYFAEHDPWKHPMSAGHARRQPFYFSNEAWATYIHIEDEADLDAQKYELYHSANKPVFHGEDRYEQDHGPVRDPANMNYFQRRLFWSWLLAGGSTNYGGRWWVVHPYSETGKRSSSPPPRTGLKFTEQLHGLDSVSAIQQFFREQAIKLTEFEAEHNLVSAIDDDGKPLMQSLKLMHRERRQWLIYHPHSVADGKEAMHDTQRHSRLRVDLSSALGMFNVRWQRADTGQAQLGPTILGGAKHELTAPWPGIDVVLYLTPEE